VIFVDTSVWVEALRSGNSATAQHLGGLLDAGDVALSAPVRIEILAGASSRDNERLRRVLSALPLFFPTEQTWTRLDEWLDRSRAAGERFGFADLLIAAIASDQNAAIWSLDSDFSRMARIGLIKVHQPDVS
jgi:predicted nucleic acid-binding protein